MSDEDDEEYSIYYPMEDICEYLQEGGGSSRLRSSTIRTDTRQLMAEFIRYGWRSDYVNTVFRRLHDKLISEYPNHIFIEKYAEAAVQRLGMESYDTVADVLIQIGLRSDVALHLEYIVQPLHGSSYSDIQIIDIAIAYLLGRYEPVAPPTVTHLIEPSVVNSWINYTRESKTIAIYNILQHCSTAALTQFDTALTSLPLPSLEGDHTFYFHATSWRGSLGIIEDVSRLVGRRCLDFGIYPGFYMSPTSSEAVGWGHKKRHVWANEVAIMVFHIPKTPPAHLRFKELTGDEWIQVTSHSRLCRDNTDLRLIRRIDLLYGDMVQNASAVRRGATPITHEPPKKQLVTKSETADAFIHKCLVGCIYFKKKG
jgi:hypothetical protein